MKRYAFPIEEIPLSSIILHDIRYKISKPEPAETLKKSISIHGILDPLLLIYCDGYYTIMAGHNRASLLNDANVISVHARVFDSFREDIFLEHGLMKNYHNELGPIGKLKLFTLTAGCINNSSATRELGTKKLNLPPEILDDQDLRNNILNFPDMLLNYIDGKDINYRTIIELAQGEQEQLQILAQWIGQIPMRVNIFKSIVDMTSDIIKRDHHIEHLYAIDIDSIQDRRMKELHLVEALREIRYPEYSKLKNKASHIIDEISKTGISVSMPEYFEGDTISLLFTVSRRDGIQKLQEQVKGIKYEKISELLYML